MRITPTVGLALVLLIAGCSNKPASQDAQAPGAGTAAAPAQKVAPPSSTSTAATPSDSASRAATASAAPATAAAKPPTTAASAPPVAAQSAALPPSKAPAVATAKAPPASPQKTPSAAPAVAAKSQPTLDIAALTQRLEDTKAIGVLSKLALKNQVDDLLDQFRAFYQGKLKTTLAELRRPYDLLVLKVLALLQDGDPSLASAIVASREAIWGILSDPKKFATVA